MPGLLGPVRRQQAESKKPPKGGFNIDYRKHPDPSKVVVVFLILLRFQKVFTFHFFVSPVFYGCRAIMYP
jgi:hypothetical protein